MKRITINEIAQAVNKSPTTVSKALTYHPGVEVNTRNSIQSFARENKFRFNPSTQLKRKINSKIIGFIAPSLASPFARQLLSYIEETLQAYGFNILFMQSKNYEAVELELIESSILMGLNALIVIGIGREDKYKQLDYLGKDQCPVIFLTSDTLKLIKITDSELDHTINSMIETVARKECYTIIEKFKVI